MVIMYLRRKLYGLVILSVVVIPLTSVFGCTIFTFSYGEKTYFGNNEDYINPNTYIINKQIYLAF